MPTDPTGRTMRNLVTIRRLSNGLAREAAKEVTAFYNEVVAILARLDPTSVAARYQAGRVERFLKAVQSASVYRGVQASLRDGLAQVGTHQARWAAGTLDAAVGSRVASTRGVGTSRMKKILREQPFDGDTLTRWVRRTEVASMDRIRRTVQRGLAQGQALGDLSRGLKRAARTSRREVEAIARTGTTFAANEAWMETYRQNSDVVGAVQFTATLDGRTTPICARWDGTIWKLDDPAIQKPPLHFNCRSILTPVVDWEGLGLEPPKTGRVTRASADGPVLAKTTYEDWFRRQSKTEQNRIIGPARAELFRNGKITFRDMVARDNRQLTVAELAG